MMFRASAVPKVLVDRHPPSHCPVLWGRRAAATSRTQSSRNESTTAAIPNMAPRIFLQHLTETAIAAELAPSSVQRGRPRVAILFLEHVASREIKTDGSWPMLRDAAELPPKLADIATVQGIPVVPWRIPMTTISVNPRIA